VVHPPPVRRRRWRTLVAASVVAAPAILATVSAPATAADGDPRVELSAPDRLVVESYRGHVWSDLGLRLDVHDAPLEIWMTRPDYESPVEVTVKKPSGDVTLPADAATRLGYLDGLLTMTLTPKGGGTSVTNAPPVCLGLVSERMDPAGPATSPYPRSCYFNPFAIGSVQGIPEGWSGSLVSEEGGSVRLKPGKYDVEYAVGDTYADAIGISAEDRVVTQRLVVERYRECRRCRPDAVPAATPRRPAAEEPRGPGVTALADLPEGTPTPDLRSLPAFDIGLNRKGTQLRFGANVWNGGNSPLVVDGFRRSGEDVMDAYQYFFDTDGEQVHYAEVGEMEWDADPTHQHWHFTDFARYELVSSATGEVVHSGKEAFCLANTDAVDLTGEGAQWQIREDDLGTSCGSYTSRSIREVLAAGWGDTYHQFRAGQAFPLKGVPDGTYEIRVIANPEGNLIESSTENNVSTRTIELRTTPKGERRVSVHQVGIIQDIFLG